MQKRNALNERDLPLPINLRRAAGDSAHPSLAVGRFRLGPRANRHGNRRSHDMFRHLLLLSIPENGANDSSSLRRMRKESHLAIHPFRKIYDILSATK